MKSGDQNLRKNIKCNQYHVIVETATNSPEKLMCLMVYIKCMYVSLNILKVLSTFLIQYFLHITNPEEGIHLILFLTLWLIQNLNYLLLEPSES